MDAGSWREKLGVESRKRVFNKIYSTMKKFYPFSGEEELKKAGLSFEEKCYSAATSQDDYLRRISVKMMNMESKSQNSAANSLQTGAASHSMQSDIHIQVPAMPIVDGQSQGQQQPLSQNMQNTNSAATSVQNSGSLASKHPAVSIANGVSQNSNSQSMQNDSNVAQNSLGNATGQEMPSNMFANSQSQMQGRLQQQQQLMKQKIQSGGLTQSMLQSHVQNQHQNSMQTAQIHSSQQTVMQPTVIQSASVSSLQQNHQSSAQQSTQQILDRQPQPVLRQHRQQQTQRIPILHQQQTSKVQQQPLTGPVSSDSGIQQNQLIGQQKNIQDMQQHRPMSQQNNSANLQQQQLNIQQNNVLNVNRPQLGGGVYGLQQSTMLGMQSFASSGIPNNQSSVHMMQQKVPAQQQLQQNKQLIASQMQSNSSQRDMQPRLPTSGAILQQQNLAEQQSQNFQSQRIIKEATSSSSDSTAKTGNAGAGDWQEEVYQKIKSMKDMYLPELKEVFLKIVTKLQQPEALPQQPTNEQLTKLKILKGVMERIVVFLQVSKKDIQIEHKDKLGTVEKQIANILSSNRQNRNRMAAASNNTGSSVPSISNSQQNMINSLQQQPPSSSSDLGLNSSLLSPQKVPGLNSSKQNNTLSGQGSIPSQAGVNTLQSNLNYLRTNSNMLQNQQMVHSQQLKRQIHQKQMQQHLSAQLPGHTESSDVNMRQQMGVKPGVYQQSAAAAYASPQVKPESPFPIPSPQVLQAGSLQVPQQPSPQINQQNLLTFSKTGTPLLSANSPFITPSPSAPVAQSPIHGESEKVNASLSPLTNTNMGQPEAPNANKGSAQSLAIGTPGISALPLIAELSSPDGAHGNTPTVISGRSDTVERERPIERLIKAVKSAASKNALSASVSELSSVVSMIDRIGGSAPGNGSIAAVGEDLVAMTKHHLQDRRNFFAQDGPSLTKKHKRYITATPSTIVSSDGSINNSVKDLAGSDDAFDMESTASSPVKRPRIEVNKSLSEEILNINRRLIDTLVEISDEQDDDSTDDIAAVADGVKGTIVKCSFNAVSLSPGFKLKYASPHMSPIEPLRMLIPINYPNCSPILLDSFPAQISKEHEDLSMKTKFRFSISLKSLSQPMSLTEIAKTWNDCARAVISEHAQQRGGGSFSSKYGTWENCIGAST